MLGHSRCPGLKQTLRHHLHAVLSTDETFITLNLGSTTWWQILNTVCITNMHLGQIVNLTRLYSNYQNTPYMSQNKLVQPKHWQQFLIRQRTRHSYHTDPRNTNNREHYRNQDLWRLNYFHYRIKLTPFNFIDFFLKNK